MYKTLIFLSIGLFPFAACAHNGVDHGAEHKNGDRIDHGEVVSSTKGKHGGVVHQVHGIDYELVIRPDGLILYLAGQGKPIDTKGAMAIATMVNGDEKKEIKLFPAGENRLEARYATKASAAPATIFINVALSGKPVVRLRFLSSEFGKT